MNLREKFLSISRIKKQILVAITDASSISISIFFSSYFLGSSLSSFSLESGLNFSWAPFLCLVIFYIFGVYRSVLRFIDFIVIYNIVKAIFTAFSIILLFNYIFLDFSPEFDNSFQLLFRHWIISLLISIVLIIGSRMCAHYFLSKRKYEKKVVIYGAGSAGIQLSEALKVSSELEPIAFIDSNKSLVGTYLGGLKIHSPEKLEKIIKRRRIDEVLIAMPSVSRSILRKLLKDIEHYPVKVRILPGLAELAQGKILVSELKEVEVSDLLGRFEVEANKNLVNKNIKEKSVLITGAGGSIGSEICRQVLKHDPSKLILLEASEFALYSIKNELDGIFTETKIYAVLGNVTNKKRVLEVCKSFDVETVYHAAAYKHVSLVEENPFEAVNNNVFGTKSCIEASIEANVETFVLISTDKAVRPTNIMGATKRLSELILQSLSATTRTKISMVRFGNVLGSSGSAIPLFQNQIKEGGPVTVTHPDVVRYFMSIPEAAELVLQAGSMGQGGDVFVLDMGEPVKILDLAKRLINLSGMQIQDDSNPNGDIQITFTGLKPGEKLFEELLIGDNVSKTAHHQILSAKEDFLSFDELKVSLDLLKKADDENDITALKRLLEKVVSGYQSSPEA